METELWEKQDLLTVIKYEPYKRNKAILALLWDLDARPHEITLLKIKHIRLREKYGEGEIPHEAKTGTGPILLTCSFPYVRDWLNEHPFKNDPNVWFLTGSGGGKAERTCAIPAEKSIFFPIINVECSYAETPTFRTETELRDCAQADQDTVSSLRLTIDGLNIENVTKYRTDSPLFNFTTPQNGLFGLNSITSQGVSDGYFVMLKPLSPGSHEISFSAFLGSPVTTSPLALTEDMTYHLTIK